MNRREALKLSALPIIAAVGAGAVKVSLAFAEDAASYVVGTVTSVVGERLVVSPLDGGPDLDVSVSEVPVGLGFSPRPGDRVIASLDENGAPFELGYLYDGVDGAVENQSPTSLQVGGVALDVDDASSVRRLVTQAGGEEAEYSSLRSTAFAEGSLVGVLAIVNLADNSRRAGVVQQIHAGE